MQKKKHQKSLDSQDTEVIKDKTSKDPNLDFNLGQAIINLKNLSSTIAREQKQISTILQVSTMEKENLTTTKEDTRNPSLSQVLDWANNKATMINMETTILIILHLISTLLQKVKNSDRATVEAIKNNLSIQIKHILLMINLEKARGNQSSLQQQNQP